MNASARSVRSLSAARGTPDEAIESSGAARAGSSSCDLGPPPPGYSVDEWSILFPRLLASGVVVKEEPIDYDFSMCK